MRWARRLERADRSRRLPVWAACVGILSLVTVLGPGTSWASDPAPGAPQAAPGAADKLNRRNELAWETGRLLKAGKFAEGLAAAEAMLRVEREIFGDLHEDTAGALESVANAHKT